MYFCNTYNKRESKYLGHLLIEYRHSCYYLQKPCPKHLNLLFMQIYDPLKYLHSYINNNRGIEGKHEYIKICYFSKYRSGSKISPINDADRINMFHLYLILFRVLLAILYKIRNVIFIRTKPFFTSSDDLLVYTNPYVA